MSAFVLVEPDYLRGDKRWQQAFHPQKEVYQRLIQRALNLRSKYHFEYQPLLHGLARERGTEQFQLPSKHV